MPSPTPPTCTSYQIVRCTSRSGLVSTTHCKKINAIKRITEHLTFTHRPMRPSVSLKLHQLAASPLVSSPDHIGHAPCSDSHVITFKSRRGTCLQSCVEFANGEVRGRTLLYCLLFGFEGLFIHCIDYGGCEYSGGSEDETTASES